MKKVAIVTGSRRGIGLGIAKALLQEGYYVVLSAVSSFENASQLISELNQEYPNMLEYIKCDISNEQDRENLINEVITKHGRLDLLVNNAGVACEKRLNILETSIESFERLIKINLEGTFFMCQLGANAMIKCQGEILENYSPRIINISSISAYTSSVSRGEYCISKAGISMTTQLFADVLADYSIPVFEVRPGIISTDMTAVVHEKYETMIKDGLTPTRRFGTVKDVADCVIAASSGLLDFGTGTVLNADGGFHLRRL